MLIDRRCYDALGGWDESFFLYSEETDFCLRARDEGWLVGYTPEAAATHIGGHRERTSLRVLMVANRGLPYEPVLAEAFKESGEVCRNARFKVLWGRR